LVKIARVVPEISSQTETQTHTDALITILHNYSSNKAETSSYLSETCTKNPITEYQGIYKSSMLHKQNVFITHTSEAKTVEYTEKTL